MYEAIVLSITVRHRSFSESARRKLISSSTSLKKILSYTRTETMPAATSRFERVLITFVSMIIPKTILNFIGSIISEVYIYRVAGSTS